MTNPTHTQPIPNLTMQIPHPKITARRIAVEQARDTEIHAELLKRGWTLRRWQQFRDDEPDLAFNLSCELYELVRARGAKKLGAIARG